MEIILNGKKIQSNSSTIMELVLNQGFNPKSLIAELNFKIIKQENWDNTALEQGDTVELLSFVQGG